MNKTRVPVAIMAVALFFAAILVLLTYINTIEARGSSPDSSGMGELRLLEAQQNTASGGVLYKSIPYVGMGDLRRIEAGQVLATTNVIGFQLSDRVCPAPSTSYGERDSGASAPVGVLLAKGC